jgi:hypothetical protein
MSNKTNDYIIRYIDPAQKGVNLAYVLLGVNDKLPTWQEDIKAHMEDLVPGCTILCVGKVVPFNFGYCKMETVCDEPENGKLIL